MVHLLHRLYGVDAPGGAEWQTESVSRAMIVMEVEGRESCDFRTGRSARSSDGARCIDGYVLPCTSPILIVCDRV